MRLCCMIIMMLSATTHADYYYLLLITYYLLQKNTKPEMSLVRGEISVISILLSAAAYILRNESMSNHYHLNKLMFVQITGRQPGGTMSF